MFLVIACIYDDTNKTIEGYRVVDLNQLRVSELMLQTFNAKTKQYNYLMPNMSFVNASYMEITQNLVSNGATPLSDYPHINKAYTRLTNEALTVAGIIDDTNGNPVGVLVFNSLGQMARLSFNDFNKAIVNKTQTNFKLVNNRPYPNNNMQDFPHIRMQQHGVNRAYHSSEGEQAPDISKNNTPTQVATPTQGNTTTPKRRGRPPKSATSVPTPSVATNVPTPPVATNVPTPPVADASVEPPKKKRGRPAKNATPTVTTPSVTTTEDDVLAPDDIVDNVEEVKPQGPFCPSDNPIKLPEIKITDLDEYVDKELNLSAQQKLMLAGLTFQEMSMYYATVYDAIDKVNDPNLGTFAVSEKQMYYDYAFAAKLSVSELVFVLMHEMMHICFMHSVRKGNRDSRLWNIATDLYINTIICQDWGIEFGGPKKVIKEEDMKKRTLEIAIKCPPFGIFLDTIDETLDLTTATAE
ncbi:MAG: hypothetical protein IKP66_09755, partial [Lachnospiraceae bacterium]|nr:hypothetical protein [Lachnospiraceae bacterium]